MTATVYAHLRPNDKIDCKHQRHEHCPVGQPVLEMGDLYIFPGTVDRVTEIRDAINDYLATVNAEAEASHNAIGAGI
jgi:hypothetical protein